MVHEAIHPVGWSLVGFADLGTRQYGPKLWNKAQARMERSAEVQWPWKKRVLSNQRAMAFI